MKKKKLLLILPISFFLCSCNLADVGIGQFKPFSSEFWQSLSIFGWQPFGGKDNKEGTHNDTPIDDVDIDENKHATSISADPSAAFYLKKGESRTVKVTLSPSTGVRDEEKTFTWSITKGDGVTIPSGVTGNTIEITAVKASNGNVVTAVNDYNHSLTKSFTIHVIDFDEENDYLWQYASEDKNQFGYTSENKIGNASGKASLNGLVWSFLREPEPTSINTTQSGCIGFGKGENPETHLHFETNVGRPVESITFEVASANSLAKMSVSVGETAYMSEKVVPKVSNNSLNFLTTNEVSTPVSGKIQIDVNTPEMDNSRKEDPDYNAPGAFYLKSILIHFGGEIEPVTVQTFNFKEMYDNRVKGDGLFGDLTTTAKTIEFSENDVDVTLEKVKAEATKDETIPGYAHTNGYIDIKLNKPNEEFYKVEFKMNYGSASSKTIYALQMSKSGGAPFTPSGIVSSIDESVGLLDVSLFSNDHYNIIRLRPTNDKSVANVGLDYLTVTTKAGINPTIAYISAPSDFEPSQKEYYDGDLFNVEGLNDLIISYNEPGVEPDGLPASEVEWFDGTSYEADPTTAKKELQAGTTKVYGVFRGEVVATVEGLTVIGESASLTLVKSANQLEPNYKYLIVGKYSSGYTSLNGAGTTNDTIKNGYVLNDFVLNDSISLSKTFETRAFTASFDGDSKLHFQNFNGNKIALNSSGITFSKTATNDAWDFVIDSENHLVMTLDNKEFGVNNSTGVFSAYSSSSTAKGSIYLYKFANN